MKEAIRKKKRKKNALMNMTRNFGFLTIDSGMMDDKWVPSFRVGKDLYQQNLNAS